MTLRTVARNTTCALVLTLLGCSGSSSDGLDPAQDGGTNGEGGGGDVDGGGERDASPGACYDIYRPVCGSDGKTYGNDCEAQRAGVTFVEGACAGDGGVNEGGGADGCAPAPCPLADVFDAATCSCVPRDDGGGANDAGPGDAGKDAAPDSGAPMCGGIANIKCPGAGVCVDDPSDSCNPKKGGADCSGICDCSLQNTAAARACPAGSRFDNAPGVCACVKGCAIDPCTTVKCGAGYECTVNTVSCTAGCTAVDPGDAGGGVVCGKKTCAASQVCCNPSCGICGPKGGACPQIVCL